MMIIVTTQDINMQCDTGSLTPALQSVVDHLCTERPYLLIFETKLAKEEWTIGKVNYSSGEGLV
jgi:hypothetical protein